jgi:antitoxin VapB
MALNIKSSETERVVRELAARTGLSITEAVHRAALDKLRAIDADKEARKAALRTIIDRSRRLPDLDPRTDDEILGYNDRGTFD